MSSYAITRYRLFDIRVVLNKSLVYGTGLIGSFAALLGLIQFLYAEIRSPFVWIVAFLFSVLFLERYKKWLKELLDGIFFLEELSLSKKLSANAKILNSTHELEIFVLDFALHIQESVKVDVLEVYITHRQHHRFKAFYPKGSKEFISFDDPLIPKLMQGEDILLKDELEVRTVRGHPDPNAKQLIKLLKKHTAEVLLLIKDPKLIYAIAFLSKKKIPEEFTTEELQNIQRLLNAGKTNLPIVIHLHETIEGVKMKLEEDEFSIL